MTYVDIYNNDVCFILPYFRFFFQDDFQRHNTSILTGIRHDRSAEGQLYQIFFVTQYSPAQVTSRS